MEEEEKTKTDATDETMVSEAAGEDDGDKKQDADD
jgi:hypothetical protein